VVRIRDEEAVEYFLLPASFFKVLPLHKKLTTSSSLPHAL